MRLVESPGKAVFATRHGEKKKNGDITTKGMERAGFIADTYRDLILPAVRPDFVRIFAANGRDGYAISGPFGVTSRTIETAAPSVTTLGGAGYRVDENLEHPWDDPDFLRTELFDPGQNGEQKIFFWEHRKLAEALGIDWPEDVFDYLVVIKNGEVHIFPQEMPPRADVGPLSGPAPTVPTFPFQVNVDGTDLQMRVVTEGRPQDVPSVVLVDAPGPVSARSPSGPADLLSRTEQAGRPQHPLYRIRIGQDADWYRENEQPLPLLNPRQWAKAADGVLRQMGIHEGMVLARGLGTPAAAELMAHNPGFARGVARAAVPSRADFIRDVQALQSGTAEERKAAAAFLGLTGGRDPGAALPLYHGMIQSGYPAAIRNFTLLTEALTAGTAQQRSHYLKILAEPGKDWTGEGRQNLFRDLMLPAGSIALDRSAALQSDRTPPVPATLRMVGQPRPGGSRIGGFLKEAEEDLALADRIIREVGAIARDIKKLAGVLTLLPASWV